MIAITIMIRPHGCAPWLEFIWHRFHRVESVALGGDQLLVWIPKGGSFLPTESANSLALPADVGSSETVTLLRSRIRAGSRQQCRSISKARECHTGMVFPPGRVIGSRWAARYRPKARYRCIGISGGSVPGQKIPSR